MQFKNMKVKFFTIALASSLTISAILPFEVRAVDLDELEQELVNTRRERELLEERMNELNSMKESDLNKMDQYDQSIWDLSDKIENENNKLEKVNEDIDEILSKKAGVQEKIDSINKDIQETLEKIYSLKADILKIEKNIERSKKKIEVLKKDIKSNTELLKERLVVMYKLGDINKIEILLQSNGVNDFLSRNIMMTNITKHDKELIEKLSSDKEALDKAVTELNGQKVTLEISKKNQDEKKKELEEKKAVQKDFLDKLEIKEEEKNMILDKYRSSIDEYESYLSKNISSKEELANRRESLEEEIYGIKAKIEEALERQESVEADIENLKAKEEELSDVSKVEDSQSGGYGSISSNTQLQWPTSATYITSYFGERLDPIGGYASYHWGLDIAGPTGTDIYAAEDGVVVHAGWYGGYGNLIIIDHGNGLTTRYGHLNGYYVSEGQHVSRGQLIAPMGTTGYSTGPHVHFEVRIDGEARNPLNYIQ